MTKLSLKPNSPELDRIMSNQLLFSWYAKMLMEDYELEMNKVKALQMYINPEIYQQIEGSKSGENVTKNDMVINGEVNRERAIALNKQFEEQLNIKVEDNKDKSKGKAVSNNGIEIL